MSNTLTRTDDLIKEIKQRQRLEREVIEAAKKWSPNRGTHATHHTSRQCPACAAERMFHTAVGALIDFESKQETK